MADTKISALTAAGSVAATNEFAINEAGASKKATAAQIKTYVLADTAYVKLTGDETGKTDSTLANTSLSFSVVSGTYYMFEFYVVYQSSVSTVGLRIGITTPAFTRFSAACEVFGLAADKAGAAFQGTINSSGDAVTSTATATITSDEFALITGVIVPSANGTLQVQYAAETTGATVTMKSGSAGRLQALP